VFARCIGENIYSTIVELCKRGKSLSSAYTLIPRLITPSINSGDKIEIEIFISGYGNVEKNKLFISFSSSALIDKENPGSIETCIKTITNTKTNEISPLAGKEHIQSHSCNEVGVIIRLAKGYFLDHPTLRPPPPDDMLAPIMAEGKWDNLPPIFLTLNTSKKTPPGNYDVNLVLTYSEEEEIRIDNKKVQVHVKSPAEKHWKKVTIIAISLAILSLIATNWNTIMNLFPTELFKKVRSGAS